MAIYELPIYGRQEIPDQYKDLVLQGLKFSPVDTSPEYIDWRNKMSYAGLNPNFFQSNAGRGLLEWVKAGADPNSPMSYAKVDSTPYSPGQASPGTVQAQVAPTVVQPEKTAEPEGSASPPENKQISVYQPQANNATPTPQVDTEVKPAVPAVTPTIAPVAPDPKYTDLETKYSDMEKKYSDLLDQFKTYQTNQNNYQQQRESMAGDTWKPGSPWTSNLYNQNNTVTAKEQTLPTLEKKTQNLQGAATFTPGIEQVPNQYQYSNGMTQQRQTNMLPWGSQYGTQGKTKTATTGGTTLASTAPSSYSRLASYSPGGTTLASADPVDYFQNAGDTVKKRRYDLYGDATNPNGPTLDNGWMSVDRGNGMNYRYKNDTGERQVNINNQWLPAGNNWNPDYASQLQNEPSGGNDMNADLLNSASMMYGVGNYYNTYGPAGSQPMYGGREFKPGYNLQQEAESRYAQGAQYEQYLPQAFQAYTQGLPTAPEMPVWSSQGLSDYGSGDLRSNLQSAAVNPNRSMITENTVSNSLYDMINRISGAQGSGNLTQNIQDQITNAIAPQSAYNQETRDLMYQDATRSLDQDFNKEMSDLQKYFASYNLSGSSAESAKIKELQDSYAKRKEDARRYIDLQTAQNAQSLEANRLPQLISALTGVAGTDQNALNLGLNLLGSQQQGTSQEYSQLMNALNEATNASATQRANLSSDYLTGRQEGLDQYNMSQQNFSNLAQILANSGLLYDQFRGTGYDMMADNADAMANLAAGYLSRAGQRSANSQGWAGLLGNLAGSAGQAYATRPQT